MDLLEARSSLRLACQMRIDSLWLELLSEYQKFVHPANKFTFTTRARDMYSYWRMDGSRRPLVEYVAQRVTLDMRSLGEAIVVIAGANIAAAEQELNAGKTEFCSMCLMDAFYWAGVCKAVGQRDILAKELSSRKGRNAADIGVDKRWGSLMARTNQLAVDMALKLDGGQWKNPRQAAKQITKIILAEQRAGTNKLSKDNAFNTIYRWLRELPVAEKMKLFKSVKRAPETP